MLTRQTPLRPKGDMGRPARPRKPPVVVDDAQVQPVAAAGHVPVHRQLLGHHGGAGARPHRRRTRHPRRARAHADPLDVAVRRRCRPHVLGAPHRGLRPHPHHGLPALPAAHLQHGLRVRPDGAPDQRLPVPGGGRVEPAGHRTSNCPRCFVLLELQADMYYSS